MLTATLLPVQGVDVFEAIRVWVGNRCRRTAAVPWHAGSGVIVDLDQAMARVGQGDASAFAPVYDELAPSVFGLIRRILGSAAQAEEVMQETFVEVWRNAGRFDAERGNARAWILTMARRRAIDRVRSEQAHRRREDRVAAEYSGRPAGTEDQAVRRSADDAARDVLGGLTPNQRQAMELAYFDGLTQSEIADRLLVPIGTIKSRMRDGLARLRKQMGAPQ